MTQLREQRRPELQILSKNSIISIELQQQLCLNHNYHCNQRNSLGVLNNSSAIVLLLLPCQLGLVDLSVESGWMNIRRIMNLFARQSGNLGGPCTRDTTAGRVLVVKPVSKAYLLSGHLLMLVLSLVGSLEESTSIGIEVVGAADLLVSEFLGFKNYEPQITMFHHCSFTMVKYFSSLSIVRSYS